MLRENYKNLKKLAKVPELKSQMTDITCWFKSESHILSNYLKF